MRHFLVRLFVKRHTFKDVFLRCFHQAEENLQAKSLRSFVGRNPGLHGVRLSMSPYREQDWMTNYPLYSVLALFG